MMLSEVSGGRNNNFDFLRFAFATLVIFSHSYPLLLKSNASEPFQRATGGQRTGGELAVDGFFILSGFLIARSWKSSRGLGTFLRSRFIRIYPGFLVAIAFSALIAAPLLSENPNDYWRAFSWRDFVVNGLNLNFYTPPTTVAANGSLWTIRYEFMCYLAVAFLGLCGLLYRGSIIFLGLVVCLVLYAGQIYFHLQPYGTSLSWLYCYPGDWPRLMADFLGGILFFACRDRIRLSWPLMSIALTVLIMFGVVVPSLGALPLAVPLLGAYVLFFFGYLPIGQLHRFAKRGDISYGMYLYAFPVQALLVRAFGQWLNPITLFLAALPFTAIFAELSWRYVESPFLAFKKRQTSTPNPASTAAIGDPPESASPITQALSVDTNAISDRLSARSPYTIENARDNDIQS